MSSSRRRSPAATHGTCSERASRVTFKRDTGGMHSGRDADRTEVLVSITDTANLICCREVESDLGPDEE